MASYFYGTAGNDSIAGGLSAGVTSNPLALDGTTDGQDVIEAYGGDDYVYAFDGDDFVYGHAGDDSLWGGQGLDLLYGHSGDDHLDGWLGGDYLAGGSGNDAMFGGPGDDGYEVDSAGDYVGELADNGWDLVWSEAATTTLWSNVEEVTLIGFIDQQDVVGNGVANLIVSYFDQVNVFNGMGGDDTLLAGSGVDEIDGGSGNDEILGEDGEDIVVGGSGDDILDGGRDSDVLRGQSGDDTLRGGDREDDTLVGGSGDDRFEFHRPSWSPPGRSDVVSGEGAAAFEGVGVMGGDKVDVSQIDANVGTVANESFIFGGTGVRHLTLSEHGNTTIVQGNTDRDGAFEIVILIEDGRSVASADYYSGDFVL